MPTERDIEFIFVPFFSAMNELDGDDIRISSRGVPAERDIVQFVPFREFVRPGVDLSVSQVICSITISICMTKDVKAW